MDEPNYWQRMQSRALSRRRLLAAAGSGGLGLAATSLIACGGSESTTAPTTTTTSAPSGTPTAVPSATVTGIPTQSTPAGKSIAGDQTLVESTGGDHATLHPWKSQGGLPTNSHVNFLEGLVYRDETGAMFNALAESYEETPDHMGWTFKLRPNTFFHNGAPVTAEDVKYSWDNGRSAETASPFGAYLANIDTVDAPDPQTVSVKMAKPDAIFLNHIAYPSGPGMPIPKAYHEQVGIDGFEQKPVGAGFFSFDSREPGNFVAYKRFDQYWRGKTKFAALRFNVVGELSTRLQLVETQATTLADQMTADSATEMTSKGFRTPSVDREPIWFSFRMANVKNPNPVFNDDRVRKALNMGIDKTGITTGVYKGFATPVNSMVMHAVAGYPPGDPYPYDPAQAKQLLDAASFDYNQELVAEAPTGRFPQMETAAQAIAASLQQIGVKLKLNLVEYATWLKDITNHDNPSWDMIILNFGNLLYDNGGTADGMITSKGTWSFMNDPELDTAVAALPTTFGADARKKAFEDLFTKVHDRAYAVFLWEVREIFGTDPRFTWDPCCAWRFHSYFNADLVESA